MSLLAQIKVAALSARKAAIADRTNPEAAAHSAILSTLLGAIETKTKAAPPKKSADDGALDGESVTNRSISDDEIVAIIQNFLKSNAIARQNVLNLPGERLVVETAKLVAEEEALKAFLPQQMSEAEIEAIVVELRASGQNLGQIMGSLNANYAGRYDRKLASDIAKRVIG